MISLDEAAGRAEAGAKAATLGRARAEGLPVLDGIVVLPDEPVDESALAAALGRLDPRAGARFAVRSSADVEDRPGASAAGVFASVLDVPLPSVAAAVERVRASARDESARAYLASRGIGAARMAVLIQPMAEASAIGVLRCFSTSAGELRAEERAPAEPEWGEVAPRTVAPDDPLAEGARRLTALVGGPVDVEYARAHGGPLFLQARPVAGGAPRPLPTEAWDPGDDGEWSRDAEHNPDPLSAAQASLVELVGALPGAARLGVLHGYLFQRRGGANPPARVIPLPSLARAFAEEIEPACEAALAPVEGEEAPSVDAALAAYRAVLTRYLGESGPSLSRARQDLDQLLRGHLGEPLAAHGALLAASGGLAVARDAALHRIGRADPLARPALIDEYLRRFGAWAPVWDVAVPTDGELPTRVLRMAALAARGPSPEERHAKAEAAARAAANAVVGRLDGAARSAFAALLPAAQEALALAEDDDALFFRAQRAVRRALVTVGNRRYVEGTLPDPALVFELPIEEVRRGAIDPDRALAARALREDQRTLAPPSEIRGRQPTWRGAGAAGVLRGFGTSGRGRGRAFVLRDAESPPLALPVGAVLVVRAILPSLSYLLQGAAALVTDHGGALCHGATLAREYGVPAVLGAGRATEVIVDGEELLVDADAGRVLRIAAR